MIKLITFAAAVLFAAAPAVAGTIASLPQRCITVTSTIVQNPIFGTAPSFKFHNRCAKPISFYYAFPLAPTSWFPEAALAPSADFIAPPLFPAALDGGTPAQVGVKECPQGYAASGTDSTVCHN